MYFMRIDLNANEEPKETRTQRIKFLQRLQKSKTAVRSAKKVKKNETCLRFKSVNKSFALRADGQTNEAASRAPICRGLRVRTNRVAFDSSGRTRSWHCDLASRDLTQWKEDNGVKGNKTNGVDGGCDRSRCDRAHCLENLMPDT